MEASDLDLRVRQDWQAARDVPNPHGLSIERNIVSPPERRTFENSFYSASSPAEERPTIELWVVADEKPPTGNGGYFIIYEERRDRFGLATAGVFIGFYGTLADTIAGM